MAANQPNVSDAAATAGQLLYQNLLLCQPIVSEKKTKRDSQSKLSEECKNGSSEESQPDVRYVHRGLARIKNTDQGVFTRIIILCEREDREEE